MTGIRADRTVIRSSMADLLDTYPSPEIVVKATATGPSWGRGAHLQSEPSVRLRYRGPLRGRTDRASSGWDARWGKFSSAVNHPTRHRPARLQSKGRSRKFSGTVTTPTVPAGSGVGCPPVGHEVCTHHTERTQADSRTPTPGRAGPGPARRAGAAPGRPPPHPHPGTCSRLDDEDHRS